MQYFGILDFSTPELVIILLIVLLLFGSKKLPELAKSLGKSAGELKKGLNEVSDLHNDTKPASKSASQQQD